MTTELESRKQALVALALSKHPDAEITPCDRPFTIYDGELFFWFNDAQHSTHIVRERHILRVVAA
jgi:hypothetical protein